MLSKLSKKNLATYEANRSSNKNIGEIQFGKSNFKLAFYALSPKKRVAISNLYTFCSYIDDIVDSSNNTPELKVSKKQERLQWWKLELENLQLESTNISSSSVLFPLKKLIEDYNIPLKYFNTLIDGVGQDLIHKRYETIDDLLKYCYGVASIVGLMCIHIFGNTSDEAKQYAINLGYALQLTNIMRDVSADFSRDYVYLPQADLATFNYSECDIKQHNYSKNFVKLMQFQQQRAENYYKIANENLHSSFKKDFLPAEIMKNIYYSLLQKISDAGYNVYSKKIRLSATNKIFITFRTLLNNF